VSAPPLSLELLCSLGAELECRRGLLSTKDAKAAYVIGTSRYWYTAKRFGVGWRTALTWEAWALDLGIVAFFAATGPWLRALQRPFLALGLVFGPLLLRAAVAHWKGEPEGWR